MSDPDLDPVQVAALDRAVATPRTARRYLGLAGALAAVDGSSLTAATAATTAAVEPIPTEPRARGAALGVLARDWPPERAAALAGVPVVTVEAALRELKR